jgi:hypothetical protein
MKLHGGLPDSNFGSDLSIRHSGHHKSHHFYLTTCQRLISISDTRPLGLALAVSSVALDRVIDGIQ